MKKFEARAYEANTMKRFAKCLVLVLCVTRAALAQDAEDVDAPPLVTVEQGTEEAPPPPPNPQDLAAPPVDPNATGVLQPPAIANVPLDQVPEATKPTEEPPGRGLRIAMGFLFGAGIGAAGGLAGGLIGSATLPDQSLQPLGAAWTGAAIGFGIFAPVGVLLSGWLFDGDGSVWATLLGDLIGAAIGAGAVVFGGTAGTPLLFALPLGGSVVGYEVTSPAAKSMVVKVSASLTPVNGGALFGFAGSF
jgi:hypothetical protein